MERLVSGLHIYWVQTSLATLHLLSLGSSLGWRLVRGQFRLLRHRGKWTLSQGHRRGRSLDHFPHLLDFCPFLLYLLRERRKRQLRHLLSPALPFQLLQQLILVLVGLDSLEGELLLYV